MKSVSFLRASWKKKEGKPLASPEDPLLSKRASRTLPRSLGRADDIRAVINSRSDSLDFLAPVNDYSMLTAGRDDQDVDRYNMLTARQRSRSMGAQAIPPDIEPRSFPSTGGAAPDVPLLDASFVTRPPRKSSLAPIPDSIRNAGTESPAISRKSSASSLRIPTSRTLHSQRSMPELDLVWEDGDEDLTPTQRDFNMAREVDNMRSKRRSRASSTTSHDRRLSNQRFSGLPPSPVPSPALSSIAVEDLTSPSEPRFRTEFTTANSRPNVASSPAYPKEDNVFPLHEADDIAHICRRLTPPPEEGRPSTSDSTFSEDTLSLFPQPPPLDLQKHLARSPTLSQYPLTPDYTPVGSPTSPTFFQSSQFGHVRKPSCSTASILKKLSAYSSLPSPPITPSSTSSMLSRSSSRSSFQMMSPEPVAPTLKIRNSSPHIASAKAHNAHRPSSSDSCSAYSVSSDHIDHDLRKQALSRSEVPTPVETLTEVETRPSSTEPDSQRVQWGYAV